MFYVCRYDSFLLLLTVEVPDQQSGHKSHNSSEDDHTDHSPDFPRTLFLLELLVIGRRQKLDGRVPVFVLEDRRTHRG